jgi:excisionase family DNA binding protein
MNDRTRSAHQSGPTHGATGERPEREPNVRLLLSVDEAAQRLHIGRSTVYTLVAQNQLESVKIGKLRRIPATALDDYVASLRDADYDRGDIALSRRS